MPSNKGRIFSGVQPTGNLHLGNYLGAIKQWVSLQNNYESIFCIVDLHAITVAQNPKELREATYTMAAAYIAAGIEPKNCIIFNQSMVPQHSELAWLLSCFTPLGWLNRMTQFKEKAGKKRDNAALGLYSYPVLMAADILLYAATHVPVGDDQKQHLELTRDIAQAFNSRFNQEIFTMPEPVIQGSATRVMSLRDGTKKMSKSDDSDMSRINMADDAETISKKIRKAKTDMIEGISYDIEKRPEASNLLSIFASLSEREVKSVAAEYASASFSTFKNDLADLAVEKIAPINQEMTKLLQDKTYLESILQSGAEKAEKIANKQLKTVKDCLGLCDF